MAKVCEIRQAVQTPKASVSIFLNEQKNKTSLGLGNKHFYSGNFSPPNLPTARLKICLFDRTTLRGGVCKWKSVLPEQIIRKNSFVIPHLDLTLFIFTVLSPFQAPESQSFLEESTGSHSQLEILPWVRGRQCAFMPVPSSILNTVYEG